MSPLRPPSRNDRETHGKDFFETEDFNRPGQQQLFQGSSSEPIPFFSPTGTDRPKENPKAKMAKRLGNLFSGKPQRSRNELTDNSSIAVLGDNATLSSDQGQHSFAGGSSVAPTVHSQITLKASNMPGKSSDEEKSKKSTKGWKKFKKLVRVKSSHKRSKPEPISISETEQKNSELDMAIRGRLDGIDCLSLGPADLSSFPEKDDKATITFSARNVEEDTNKDSVPPSIDFDPLNLSFTTLSKSWNPSDIVADSIWSAGGMDRSELILEGFGFERWTLRFNESPSTPSSASTDNSKFAPKLQPIDDDESSTLTDHVEFPLKGLWNHLWGAGKKVPSPINSQEDVENEDLLESTAACSVPVDLDEGTFIIDSPDHLRSVHELVTIPLQAQRFDNALAIFDKLLKGLEQGQNAQLGHLVGSTHHNMGMVHLCVGNFEEALQAFEKAVQSRVSSFSQKHSLVAVSLVRLGDAFFALGLFNDALGSMTKALEMSPTENASRAKILNNIGVIHYQLAEYEKSLEAFISALEIQRQWLDGPIRRQPIVYDASVTMCNMGKLYIKQDQYKLSYNVFEEAFVLQTSAFPKDHDVVLSTLKSMALVLAKNNQSSEALPILRNLLRHQEDRLGTDSEEYIETMGLIGCILAKDLELEEAAKSLSTVISWQKKHLSRSDSRIRMSSRTLETIEDMTEGKISIWV